MRFMFSVCSTISNKSILLFPAAFLAVSCGKPDNQAEQNAINDRLQNSISALRSSVIEKAYDSRTTAWLTPTEKGFSLLNTDMGVLAFSVESIKALGDGSELTLKIGNPTTATITSLKFHAQWGPVDAMDLFVDGKSREGDKEVSTPLLPGAWNTITMTFAGVQPNQMGRIEISKPQIANISLRPL